jgi:hypothetical protein
MSLENMSSERSQAPKAKYCMILFILNVRDKQLSRDRKLISARGREERKSGC